MSYKVLYRKYRPQDFENYSGQENIRNILTYQVKKNKISHAYLFSGPRGTGKTTTARIFAKMINCQDFINGTVCNSCMSCTSYFENPDIIEIDAASNNGVEEIRNLRDNVKILPGFSKYKIYIIDEVHMLTTSAWNAFLKTLEEPPKHVIFIMATTEVQKIPITVLSRCQRFLFNKFNKKEISDNIKKICEIEKWKIDDEASEYIGELADGSMRDALNILEQVSTNKSSINIQTIQNLYGLIDDNDIKKIFEHIKNNDIKKLNELVNKISQNINDSNIILSNIINEIYNLLINNDNYSSYNIELLKKLSLDLSSIFNKRNSIELLKIILITFMIENNNEIISREIILEPKKILENIEDSNITNKKSNNDSYFETESFIDCRINNAFYDADKKLKDLMTEKWKKFIKNLDITKDKEILSIIEDTIIAVVSPTNILFFNSSKSTTLLFNEKLLEIEEQFNQYTKKNFKMICIEFEKWELEKEKYIKKRKKYKYIQELSSAKAIKLNEDNDIVNTVSEIFDESLIEIN